MRRIDDIVSQVNTYTRLTIIIEIGKETIYQLLLELFPTTTRSIYNA